MVFSKMFFTIRRIDRYQNVLISINPIWCLSVSIQKSHTCGTTGAMRFPSEGLMMHGFFAMYGVIILIIVTLYAFFITYRGREFSWPAFGVTLVLQFGVIHLMDVDGIDPIYDYRIMVNIWVVVGILGQIFMGLWFHTRPPKCPKCGHVF